MKMYTVYLKAQALTRVDVTASTVDEAKFVALEQAQKPEQHWNVQRQNAKVVSTKWQD